MIIASTDASTGTYSWTIPDAIGLQSRVKITDTSDADVYDTSDANFTIKGVLTLTAPIGGESWQVSNQEVITWDRLGSISTVLLEYSTNAFADELETVSIASGVDAVTGTPYTWTIPDAISNSVKVRVTNEGDTSVLDTSDTNFKIMGRLTLTAPNGAEEWGVTTSQKITWSTTGTLNNVKLEYSIDGGSNFNRLITASTSASSLEYYWTIPDDITTMARVKITDADDASVYDTSDADFTIQSVFTLTAPNGAEVWIVGNSYDINWSNTGTVANVKLEYSTDGGSNYDDVIIASTPNASTYSWSIPDDITTTAKVKVSDAAVATSFDESNSTFNIRGAVTLTSPNGGEVWIVGESRNVTWTKVGTISTVKLEYSTNGFADELQTVGIATLLDAASATPYSWTIPDAISANIKVRVTNEADSTVSDVSDATFTIKGSLTLTAPNGAEEWIVASSHNITWTKTGSINTVALEYTTDGGLVYNSIAAGVDATTGSPYAWTVPDALSTTVRVKVTNEADSTVSDSSDTDFTIRGALTLTAPNGGEIWFVGSSENITWTRTGSIPAIKIDYSTNSGGSYDYQIIPSTDASTGTYAFTVPDAIGENIRLKITDTGNSIVTDASNADFTIKGVLQLTAPNGGEIWLVGDTQNITWLATGSINNVKLDYSDDGGNTYAQPIIASTNGLSGTYSWTLPDSTGTNRKVKVSDASDASVSDDSDAVFTIRAQVQVTAPNGGES